MALVLALAGCASVPNELVVYARWGDESLIGLATLTSSRTLTFEVRSLDRTGLTCRVFVKLGANGFGDGSAACGPDGTRVPVEAFHDERSASITVLLGRGAAPDSQQQSASQPPDPLAEDINSPATAGAAEELP